MSARSQSSPAPAGARWDPGQYTRFADERARPFRDLLAQLDVPWAREVADLGCGPGNLTAELSDRWPAAHVVGLDNSPDMLAAARRLERPGRLEFVEGDVAAWQPGGPVDVIVSNATLHWVPEHLGLLGRLADHLAPGGALALQVPGNFTAASHALLEEVIASPRWRDRLDGKLGPRPASHDPADYLEALLAAGLQATAWETTYVQVLPGEQAVLEWMKGTTLRPVLAALDADAEAAFLEDYGALLAEAYPRGAHGTVLPFRRVFAVARRAGGAGGSSPEPPAVASLDHVQVAIPTGGEEAGRAFYGGVLGFRELAKPPQLARRGGCWFRGVGAEVHLGVDGDFRPARKAHVALAVTGLDAMAEQVAAAGWPVTWDDELAPRRRFYTDDPFGNRLEIMERPG